MTQDLERILRNIFDRSLRQSTSSREVPQALAVYDELPIANTGVGMVDLVTQPLWAPYRLTDEVVDHFIANSANQLEEDLDNHETDTEGGRNWVIGSGTIGVKSAGGIYENGGANAIYTVDREHPAMSNQVVSICLAGTDASNQCGGIIFRFSNTSNYWRFYVPTGSNQFLLERVVGGAVTTEATISQAPALHDCLKVVAYGTSIKAYINGKGVANVISTQLQSNSGIGVYIPNGGPSGAILREFHAWNISEKIFTPDANPGHTSWGTIGSEHYGWKRYTGGTNFVGSTGVIFQELMRDRFQVDTDIDLSLRHEGLGLYSWDKIDSTGKFRVDPLGWATRNSIDHSLDVVDADTADVRIAVKLTGGTVRPAGIAYRVQDVNDYWQLIPDLGSSEWFLEKVVAGTPTTLIDTGVVATNQDMIEVRCFGNIHQVYINGIFRGQVSDATGNTQDRHGLLDKGAGASILSLRFTNFRLWKVLAL